MRITDWFQTLTPQQRGWLPYVVLSLSVFTVYANVYQNAFVWDDLHTIAHNNALKHWGSLFDLLGKPTNGVFYRPVQVLLYFFIYQIFGLSEAAFHTVNILLQTANVCLVYRLGCRLGFYPRAAFAAALLWGIHPLWVDDVAYVSATAVLLEEFFLMTGLLVLLPDFTPRKICWASLLFVLALGSKESAVVFSALATFTLFLVSKERLRPALYLRTGPLWLLSMAYIIGWLTYHGFGTHYVTYDYHDIVHTDLYEHNFINRVLTSLATLPVYLGLLVWPADLHMDWNFPIVITPLDWQVIGGITMIVASLLYIIRGRGKRGLPLTWGLLWFAAALSPNTGILEPINAIFAEGWIYLPTIGLFLGLSQTAVVWMNTLPSKKVPVIAAGLVALVTLGLGVKTHLQNETLHDSVSLFENIIKYNPESASAHYNLGLFYFNQAAYEKAAEQWRQTEVYGYDLSKEADIEMHTWLAFIYLNIPPDKKDGIFLHEMINALPSSRHIPEAIDELKMAQEVDPEACCANSFLAGVYYYLGDKTNGDYYKALAEKVPAKNKPNPP